MQPLRAVFAKLGFDIETDKVVQAGKAFDALVSKVASAVFAFRAVGAASRFLNEQIKAGSEIKILADQLGMTTEEIQKYKFAADQVGLTTQQMVTAFKTLANHMGASQTLTGMSHGIKMWGQYGLSVRDAQGKMETLPNMLGKVADKMKTMDNAAQRVRLANELMGEMGFRMIPLLMQGGDAVRALFKDFDTLNLAMSEEFVKSAFVVGSRMKVLRTAFNVFKSEIALGIFPFL